MTMRELLREMTAATRPRIVSGTVSAAVIEDLTPRMRRIHLQGGAVRQWPGGTLPADALRIFFDPDRGMESPSRPYTARTVDVTSGTMAVDVLRHGTSTATRWVEALRTGDPVLLAGPRHEFALPEGTGHVLLAGDESALPALSAIAESLSCRASVLALTASPEDRVPIAGDVRWLLRDAAGPGLAGAAADIEFDPTDTVAWIAGETGEARAVRAALEARGLDRSRTRAVGYWRRAATSEQLDAEMVASGATEPDLD